MPKRSKREQHIWTREDNELAVEAYYKRDRQKTIDILAQKIGTTIASVELKFKNIEFLETDGKSGLSHTDTLLIKVWESFLKS